MLDYQKWSVAVSEGEASESPVTLSRAILVYQSPDRTAALATVHSILGVAAGVPTLLPGELLTHEGLEALLSPLKQQGGDKMELFPSCLLFANTVRMVWYRPAQRRPIYFKTTDIAFNAEMNGAEVWHPALVFVAASGRLFVFALATDGRPDGKTPVYRAPYFNIYTDGMMCAGNTRPPTTVHPSQIDAFERCFFETNFTHSNVHSGALTANKSGHDGFWKAMAGKQATPSVEWLVPLKKTITEALNGVS
jgi:PRTRC genetic system protein B